MSFFRPLLVVIPICGGIYLAFPKADPRISLRSYERLPLPPFDSHPNSHFLTKYPQRIGIIGAGASGLIAAKTMKVDGFNVEVMEKKAEIGGNWGGVAAEKPLGSAGKRLCMPDFAFRTEISSWEAVEEFFEKYVTRFRLTSKISVNTDVQAISQNSDGTWTVTISELESRQYDFLILCPGLNGNPQSLDIPGRNTFKGEISHVSQFIPSDFHCANKRIVYIGDPFAHSDVLESIALSPNVSITVICPAVPQSVPPGKLFGLNLQSMLGNRFARRVLGRMQYNDDPEERWRLWVRPVANLYWKVMQWMTRMGIPQEIYPVTELKDDLERDIGVRSERLVSLIESGTIRIERRPVSSLEEDGIRLESDKLQCDLLIHATPCEPNLFGIPSSPDGLWLYRSVLIPGVRNLAVIGLVDVPSSLLVFNLQCAWLGEVLRGSVSLPSPQEMKADVEYRKAHERIFSDVALRAYRWCEFHLISLLLFDMQLNEIRAFNRFNYWFSLPKPRDYRLVVTHKK